MTRTTRNGFLATWCVMMAVAAMLVLAGCGAKAKTDKGPGAGDITSKPGGTGSDNPGGVPDASDDPMRISEMNDIHFDFDRYDIRSGDREILMNNGKWMNDNSGARVLIEGHCDERGTVEYNLALGEKRARAAREFLVSYGVSQDRLDVISYGKERPVDPRGSEDAWAMNRRAHFVRR